MVMSDFLSKLTPVKRGMSPAQLASPERIEALQQAIVALWEGRNLTTRGVPVSSGASSRHGRRFVPLFAHGKLRIGLGTVALKQSLTPLIKPHYPLFNEVKIDADEAPAMDLADMAAGDYQIVLLCSSNSRIVVQLVSEEIVKEEDEQAVQLATFTMGAGAVGVVEDVQHLWRSDVFISRGACPFGDVFVLLEGEIATTYLSGGVLTGGETNDVIADIEIDLGSPNGTWLWMLVECEVVAEDDVLLPGVERLPILGSHRLGMGLSIPDNVMPTGVAPSGLLHVPLGHFTGDAFIPCGCGNVTINFCPGNLTYTRG